MARKSLAALEALAEVSPEERGRAFEQAQAFSRDADREVRAASAKVIASIATPEEAEQALGQLVQDPDVGVRYAAIAAIAGTPWRFRFAVLRRALEDSDLGIVSVAADGLSYAGDARALPALRRLMAEKNLRFTAMEGLCALHDREFLPTAERILGAFFGAAFEKAAAALALAREGNAPGRRHLLQRLKKIYAEERNFIAAHLAAADPGEGRAAVEEIARKATDPSCETALIALARLDRECWGPAEEAIARNAETDAEAAAETLLGLSDIDWQRVKPVAELYLDRTGALGVAARKVRLAAWLRATFPGEVQLRCD